MAVKTNPALEGLEKQKQFLYPHLLASTIEPRWVNYDHIRFLSKEIAWRIAQGGARLIIEAPPRHGKSWLISLMTPIWFFSNVPHKKVIVASYESDVAVQWGRSIRNYLERHQLPASLREDSKAANRFDLNEGGSGAFVGVGGAITGKGGDLIIIDDPIKNWRESQSKTVRENLVDWYGSTIYTRLEPGASLIVMHTRWNEGDLAGHLKETGEFETISLPAIADLDDPMGRDKGEPLCPERYNLEALAKIKRAIGSKKFSALYDGKPSPDEGVVFKKEWLRYYRKAFLPDSFDMISISGDFTFKDDEPGEDKKDYTVLQVWAKRGVDHYLLAQIRDKMDFNKQVAAIKKIVGIHKNYSELLIEDKANGSALISFLEGKIAGIIEINPKESKVIRADAVTPFWEAGEVHLPHPDEEPWVQEDFIPELLKFPNADNDDQVDTMTQYLQRQIDDRDPILIV